MKKKNETAVAQETGEKEVKAPRAKKPAAPKKAAPEKKKADTARPTGRKLTGEVVSDKMDKTIVVRVERSYIHPLLKKVMRTSKKYKVHDDSQSASQGDIVEIYEGRPLSKTKYMYLARIVRAHS